MRQTLRKYARNVRKTGPAPETASIPVWRRLHGVVPLHLIVAMLFGWLEREQHDVIEFLREENRVLKAQLHGRRLQLNDDERRRLAVIGQRLGRRILAEVATIVTPDTILRWHRELIARKWTYVRSRPGRPGVQVDIQRLVVRMATDNPTWGYTRIQGAPQEPQAPRRPFNDCRDPANRRHSARAGTSDLVADVPAVALG